MNPQNWMGHWMKTGSGECFSQRKLQVLVEFCGFARRIGYIVWYVYAKDWHPWNLSFNPWVGVPLQTLNWSFCRRGSMVRLRRGRCHPRVIQFHAEKKWCRHASLVDDVQICTVYSPRGNNEFLLWGRHPDTVSLSIRTSLWMFMGHNPIA